MVFFPYNRNFKDRVQKLRKARILSEVLLWSELKQRKILGYQFLRQKPIDNYIVDFYCTELKLAIEIDGSSHDSKVEEDIFRQSQLESLGISFLRFKDEDVRNNLQGVVNMITEKIKFTSPHLGE